VTDATIVDDLCATVRDAPSVHAVGHRTHWEVGGTPEPGGIEVSAPAGVVTYDPRDLTVTVAAGTTVAELAATLAEHGQECALDPRSNSGSNVITTPPITAPQGLPVPPSTPIAKISTPRSKPYSFGLMKNVK